MTKAIDDFDGHANNEHGGEEDVRNVAQQQGSRRVIRAGRPHSGFDVDRMRELHAHGLCDAHIAQQMGKDPKTVGSYRRKLGLHANVYDPRSNNSPKDWDPIEAQRLYDDGCTDMVIARVLGVGRTTIRTWRTGLNLPPRQRGTFDEERARELYDQGSSDGMLAKALGVSRTAILYWREQNGLAPILKRQRLDEATAKQMYNDGCGDTQIAQQLGVNRSAVLRWRQRENLPSVRSCLDQERAHEMWRSGATDRMIAEELGSTVLTVQQWRRRHRLPVNSANKCH